MFRGLAHCVSPELVKVLGQMRAGDEIVFADTHFSGRAVYARVLRADGLVITTLLEGVLPLFELDSNADALVMMAAVPGEQTDPQTALRYMEVIHRHVPRASAPVRVDQFEFYERVRKAFAVVLTGETAAYGSLILRKGAPPIMSPTSDPKQVPGLNSANNNASETKPL